LARPPKAIAPSAKLERIPPPVLAIAPYAPAALTWKRALLRKNTMRSQTAWCVLPGSTWLPMEKLKTTIQLTIAPTVPQEGISKTEQPMPPSTIVLVIVQIARRARAVLHWVF
jgi:hypothetical protein